MATVPLINRFDFGNNMTFFLRRHPQAIFLKMPLPHQRTRLLLFANVKWRKTASDADRKIITPDHMINEVWKHFGSDTRWKNDELRWGSLLTDLALGVLVLSRRGLFLLAMAPTAAVYWQSPWQLFVLRQHLATTFLRGWPVERGWHAATRYLALLLWNTWKVLKKNWKVVVWDVRGMMQSISEDLRHSAHVTHAIQQSVCIVCVLSLCVFVC